MFPLLILLFVVLTIPASSVTVVYLLIKKVRESYESAKTNEFKYKELQLLVETINTSTFMVKDLIEIFSDRLHVEEKQVQHYVKALNKLLDLYGEGPSNEFMKQGTVYEANSIYPNWVNTGQSAFELNNINLAFSNTRISIFTTINSSIL